MAVFLHVLSRATREPAVTRSYGGGHVDAISFTADAALEVHGFLLYGACGGPDRHRVRALLFEGGSASPPRAAPLAACDLSMTSDGGKAPLLVSFDAPARVRRGALCTLAVTIAGFVPRARRADRGACARPRACVPRPAEHAAQARATLLDVVLALFGLICCWLMSCVAGLTRGLRWVSTSPPPPPRALR